MGRGRDAALHLLYRASLVGKAALGLAQLAGGAALWRSSSGAIPRFVRTLTGRELAEDPSDLVVTRLTQWAGHIGPGAETFYTWYLLGHGALNFTLAVLLWFGARRITLASLAVLVAFVAYQLIEFARTGDPGLIVLTGIDLAVIALALHDLRRPRETET